MRFFILKANGTSHRKSEKCKLESTRYFFHKATSGFESSDLLRTQTITSDQLAELYRTEYCHNSLKESQIIYRCHSSPVSLPPPSEQTSGQAEQKMDFLPLASAAYQFQSVPSVLLCADLKPAPLHQRNRHLQKQRETSEPRCQMLSLLSVYQHCILSTGLPVQNSLFIFSKFGSGQQRSAQTAQ